MITEYPLEHRRYDQSEYEPFWAAAAALDLPLSLHTATRRQGKIRGAGGGSSAVSERNTRGSPAASFSMGMTMATPVIAFGSLQRPGPGRPDGSGIRNERALVRRDLSSSPRKSPVPVRSLQRTSHRRHHCPLAFASCTRSHVGGHHPARPAMISNHR
jgi:hypothetical protein